MRSRSLDLEVFDLMTKPRRKPPTQFHAFLVEPQPDFKPSNWRQTPAHYRIVEYVGPKHFKGRADAWKFLHNHEAIHKDNVGTWAIYLDFAAPIFDDQPAGDESALLTEQSFATAEANELVTA